MLEMREYSSDIRLISYANFTKYTTYIDTGKLEIICIDLSYQIHQ